MAPVTRRQKAAASEAFAPSRKTKHAREESWEFLENRAQNKGAAEQSFSFRSSIQPPNNDALQPLRTMADRVGKEVEKFSEIMDSWYNQVHNTTGPTRQQILQSQFHSTARFASKLRDQAVSHTNNLKRGLTKEDLRSQAEEWRQRLHSQREGTSSAFAKAMQRPAESDRVKELRNWQAEVATWELVTTLLPERFRLPGVDQEAERKEAQNKLGKIHRYSNDEHVWQHFLLREDRSKERHLVLKWLQQSMDRREDDVDQISQQLETEEEEHKGHTGWSMGWMNTREKIKQDKRLNGWSRPVEPGDAPLIGGVGGARSGRLVTQLDPDAPLRQNRPLEGPDAYHERFMWMATYNLLKRGKSWTDIREWFAQRNESWRGVSLGMTGDNSVLGFSLSGPDRGALWRRLCSSAAQAAKEPYERAVYGLLGGDLQSVLPVCRTWEDHLFAHYSCQEIADLDSFLHRTHPQNGLSAVTKSSIKTLSKKPEAPVAAQGPMQLIQESLIHDNFEELLYNVGIAIANAAHSGESDSNLIPKISDKADEKYLPFTEDPQALRVLIHLLCIFGFTQITTPKTEERHIIIENVIIGYVDFLRQAGKIDLLPLYARQLGHLAAERTLGRICMDITNPTDQKRFVKFMYQKNIAVDQVLIQQYTYAISESGVEKGEPVERYTILEDTDKMEEVTRQLWPGKRVRDGLLQGDLGGKETAVIQSLGWFMHISKGWHFMFSTLADALTTFLIYGKVEAAVALCEQLSTKEVSRAKIPQYYPGDELDITEWSAAEEKEQYALHQPSRAGSKLSAQQLEIPKEAKAKIEFLEVLKGKCKVYYQLEQLVCALHALREWRDAEDFALDARIDTALSLRRSSNMASAKASTKDSFERLRDAMEPILAGDFLSGEIEDDGIDYKRTPEQEILSAQRDIMRATRLRHIRNAYLPEIILAYLSALQASAFLLTRENFAYAMGLAAQIASDENLVLSQSFVETGRMGELVEAFANVSKVMLKAGAGDSKKGSRQEKRRGWEGQTARIWDMGEAQE